jgi:hydrogenase maturation protease
VVASLEKDFPHLAIYGYAHADLSHWIDTWKNKDVVLIDVILADGKPGQRYVAKGMDALILQKEKQLTSHGLGLAEALELSRLLRKAPRSLYFIGVCGDHFGMDEPIQPPLQAALPAVKKEVVELLQTLYAEGEKLSKVNNRDKLYHTTSQQ